jgi:uncharacterized membrane-anchored protein
MSKRNSRVIQNAKVIYKRVLKACLVAEAAVVGERGSTPNQVKRSRLITWPAAINEQQHEFSTEQWKIPWRNKSQKSSRHFPTGISGPGGGPAVGIKVELAEAGGADTDEEKDSGWQKKGCESRVQTQDK